MNCRPQERLLPSAIRFAVWVLLYFMVVATARATTTPLAPETLVASADGQRLYIACRTANALLVLNTRTKEIEHRIEMPGPPSGLAASSNGSTLYVTCALPQSKVCVVDLGTWKIAYSLSAGHTAAAPVLSPDGERLFVCNRFDNDVSVFDLAERRQRGRIKVLREPAAADITRDGRYLLVANYLHEGAIDFDRAAAAISIIDTRSCTVTKELRLPDGGGIVNDLRVSPDGKYAVLTHVLSRFRMPATQVERGWMNTNAKTIISLSNLEVLTTVLLDGVDSGAANPWGIAWGADSARILVAHSGTREVSWIDFSSALKKFAEIPRLPGTLQKLPANTASRIQADVPNDLRFLTGIRQRVKLPAGDVGPRGVAVIGSKGYVANYFSDTITVIDFGVEPPKLESISLGPRPEMSTVRQGELNFHDGTLCYQGWQSCATCHPGEGRADGINWDLLNDGLGNAKNTKSLLLAHATPPAMSMGVRETAETAVRAGIRHILFTEQPEAVACAIDTYLESLRPVPSPHLVDGQLSAAAKRGKKVFGRSGCADCHPTGVFTDLKSYNVGTRSSNDIDSGLFDTPGLAEVWRTAPYLHDGSAATVREVLTTRNPKDEHGRTSQLSEQELQDLEEYVLSL